MCLIDLLVEFKIEVTYIYIYINYVHISKGAAGENLKAVLRLLFPLVRQSGTTTFCQLMGSVWGGGV